MAINNALIETTVSMGSISCLASVEDSSRYFVLQSVKYDNEAGTYRIYYPDS
jgi:hypothetical protein